MLPPTYKIKRRAHSQRQLCCCVIVQEVWCMAALRHLQNKIRESFRVAWTKASQVWITGMKTGEYEKKIFNSE
jgi:hypothetical protein